MAVPPKRELSWSSKLKCHGFTFNPLHSAIFYTQITMALIDTKLFLRGANKHSTKVSYFRDNLHVQLQRILTFQLEGPIAPDIAHAYVHLPKELSALYVSLTTLVSSYALFHRIDGNGVRAQILQIFG